LFLLFFLGCEHEQQGDPNFPAEPLIKFKNLEFIEGTSMIDSIQLTFSYRDGDLGLEYEALDSPYHFLNLFVEDGTSLLKVSTNNLDAAQRSFSGITQSQKEGRKLVAYRTRKKASFGFLPEFNCQNYAPMEILIPEKNKFSYRRFPQC
jgi:hypothetical protein